MEKQKKSFGTIALVVLLLIVTVVSLILATYAWAKYTTTNTSNATANVAKWNVSFTPDNSTFTGHYSHVVEGKIAPGTTGTFTVTPVPADTEVCFNYTIKIDSIDFMNGTSDTPLADSTVLDGSITLANLRSHIVFTSGNIDLTDGTNSISGTYNLGDGANSGSGTHNNSTGAALANASHTITWTWAFSGSGNYDEVDTAAGKYADANGLRMKVNYSATAVQVEPNATNH